MRWKWELNGQEASGEHPSRCERASADWPELAQGQALPRATKARIRRAEAEFSRLWRNPAFADPSSVARL